MFEVGNKLAANKKRFQLALEKCLRGKSKTDQWRKLQDIAEELTRIALEAESESTRLQAITLIAERLDGKTIALPDNVGDGHLVISWMAMGGQVSQATALPQLPQPDVIEHIPHNTPQHVDVNASKPGFQAHTPLDVVVSDTADQVQSKADAADPSAAD